jgi:hypothetical protein
LLKLVKQHKKRTLMSTTFIENDCFIVGGVRCRIDASDVVFIVSGILIGTICCVCCFVCCFACNISNINIHETYTTQTCFATGVLSSLLLSLSDSIALRRRLRGTISLLLFTLRLEFDDSIVGGAVRQNK